VSSIWETRHRLLVEHLEALGGQLSGKAQTAPEEQAARLLAATVNLLRQHCVDKRGQCRFCTVPYSIYNFWRRRPRCAVYRGINFAMTQPLDVVLAPFGCSPDFRTGKNISHD
jgi:hypothetical protein